MMAYLNCISKSFSKNLAYRSEVWISIIGNMIAIWIEISIWKALIGTGTMNGISLQDMMTYTVVTLALSIILLTDVFHLVDAKLKSGNIAMDLIKPLRFPLLLVSNQMGSAFFQLLFNLVPTVLIASLLIGVSLPPPSFVVPFLLASLIAMILSFLIGYLIALIGFWVLTTFALDAMLRSLTLVFSGAFVPVWFFPPGWATVAHYLPFQYLGFVPASIYLGKVPLAEVWSVLGWGVGWILLLLGGIYLFWWKAVNRLMIQGG